MDEKLERKMSQTCVDSRFDRVMEKVGYQGPFQYRFNMIFNFVLVILVSMPYLNIILALAVPDHWCHVPGRNSTTFSLEQWKNLTLPKEYDLKGIETISKCTMYNFTNFYDLNYTARNDTGVTVECQHGWEFDKTWYEETAPSEGKWVCENELLVSNAFAFGRIGDVVGTFTFGQLGDILGRKPVFYITLVTLLLGRTLSAFSAHNYPLFVFATLLGSLASTAVFQAPLIIAMEISEENRRAHIAMLQCVAWTFGMCAMPFILWAWGHWFNFMLSTTFPCIIFLFTSRWMIESPRWLAAQGKIGRSIKELKKIAKINGTTVPEDAMITLRQSTDTSEKVFGVMSLFSSWRLARNTLLLIVCWINGALIYYVLILNVGTLGGNPFLNFFYQAIVELPAYVLAKNSCDKIGRRWSQVIPNLFGTVGCLIMIILVSDPEMELIVSMLSALLKFITAYAFYGCNLQTLEIYPTCVRQSGLALGCISASGIGILGPYIVYLGKSYNVRYPSIILAFLAFTGAICASFLPETLHQKLPETLADADRKSVV